MGPQRDGRLGRDNGDPRAGRSPQQRPRVPRGWVGGAHHDGNAGEEHSRNKLPEPGEASRRKLRSQVIRRHPQTPGDPPLSRRDAQGWLVSGEGMRRDGIEGQERRGKADEVGSRAAPPHHPASTQHTHRRSPQPQRLPNSKLDFVAQDLADLWTQTGQRQPG